MSKFLPNLFLTILAAGSGLACAAGAEKPPAATATSPANPEPQHYFKEVKAEIASRWYWHMKNERERYTVGSTKVAFRITPEGRIDHVRLVSNTSNDAFARMCVAATEDSKLPKPPAELLALMRDGGLEHDFTFNYVATAPSGNSATAFKSLTVSPDAAPARPDHPYLTQVKTAISSHWNAHMKSERERYETGSTKVAFRITPTGKIDRIRIIGNTSDEAFARLCVASVEAAKVPKPPAEILAMMKDGGLEQDFKFNLVPPPSTSRRSPALPKPQLLAATPVPRGPSESRSIPFRKEPEGVESAKQHYEKRRAQ